MDNDDAQSIPRYHFDAYQNVNRTRHIISSTEGRLPDTTSVGSLKLKGLERHGVSNGCVPGQDTNCDCTTRSVVAGMDMKKVKSRLEGGSS